MANVVFSSSNFNSWSLFLHRMKLFVIARDENTLMHQTVPEFMLKLMELFLNDFDVFTECLLFVCFQQFSLLFSCRYLCDRNLMKFIFDYWCGVACCSFNLFVDDDVDVDVKAVANKIDVHFFSSYFYHILRHERMSVW